MNIVITPVLLFALLVLLACALAYFVDVKYFWILVLAFGALFSTNELSIHIDAKNIAISYVPPNQAANEKGGV